MQILWNQQTADWFLAASEYTGYNKALADLILKYIESKGSICDMGCGLGLIDLELAKRDTCDFSKITCVDVSKEAVHLLDEIIKNQSAALNLEIYKKIQTICADGTTIDGKWDTVLALFHGGKDVVPDYLEKAEKTLILTVFQSRIGSFGPSSHKEPKGGDVSTMEEYLKEHGINYVLENVEMEHGQPFISMEDARAFIAAYTKPMTNRETEDYLEANLQKTGREDYPFYLPKKKRFGLFIIKK